MMFNSKLKLFKIAAVTFLFMSSGAHATGYEHGNGGDQVPGDVGAAWFLGNAPVKACLDLGPDFPVAPETVQLELNAAIATWKTYFQTKAIPGRGQLSYGETSNDPDFNWTIALQCAGNEDVQIILGKATPDTTEASKLYFDPTAFAYQKSYDVSAGWSKGLIWVADAGPGVSWNAKTWDGNSYLQAIFLHELGHILGCAHANGTIMDAKIVDMLHSASITFGISTDYLKSIDNNDELILNPDIGFSVKGFLQSEFQPAFGVSVPSQGSNFAMLISPTATSIKLQLGSDSNGPSFPIQILSTPSEFSNTGIKAFLIYHGSGNEISDDWWLAVTGEVIYGTMTLPSGVFIVSIERNLSSPGVVMRSISGPQTGVIFSSEIVEW